MIADSDRGGAEQRAPGEQTCQPGGAEDCGQLAEGQHHAGGEGGGVAGEGEE